MPKPRAQETLSKPASPKRPVGNRPAVVRMKRIFDRLKQGDYPNCNTLAQELETSSKTISRDIEFMRDQLALPIAYDAQEHGYGFTEPVHEFPTIQVTQGELLALLVAQNAIEQYRGTPYHAQLETAFAKLLAPLDGMTGYAPTDDLVSFKVTAPAKHELDVFDLLTRAIGDQFEITFEYRKLGDPTPAPRRVQPLHLAHREGRWYLIAYDTDRTAMRTFALGRITDAQATAKTFERPGDFSVDRYFAAALGVMNGKENHHVRIRFFQTRRRRRPRPLFPRVPGLPPPTRRHPRPHPPRLRPHGDPTHRPPMGRPRRSPRSPRTPIPHRPSRHHPGRRARHRAAKCEGRRVKCEIKWMRL
jgi:predicted DNA-binding transcriptional regulator YafY